MVLLVLSAAFCTIHHGIWGEQRQGLGIGEVVMIMMLMILLFLLQQDPDGATGKLLLIPLAFSLWGTSVTSAVSHHAISHLH